MGVTIIIRGRLLWGRLMEMVTDLFSIEINGCHHFRTFIKKDHDLMNTETTEKSTSELLDAIGARIKGMSVYDISKETGETGREIRTYLTRHGITIRDYDGASKKTKTTITPTHESLVEIRNESAEGSLAEIRNESAKIGTKMGIVFAIGGVAMTWWGFATFGGGFFLFWIALSVGMVMAWVTSSSSMSDIAEKKKTGAMTPEEKDSYAEVKNRISEQQNTAMANYRHTSQFGNVNQNLVCPHCQTKGNVRSKASEEVTSAKVIPVVGNTIKARKRVTQMHCDNCGTTWNI